MALQTPLQPGERLVKESGATEIPLSDVADMRKVWTKFLGAIPIAPNSIALTTTGGQEHRIVCNKRDAWIEAVRSQAAAAA